jgi:hypothetical protein
MRLIIICVFQFMLEGKAFALDKTAEEVFLKKLNQRLSLLLRESYEASVFLEEDLTKASEFLARAKIIWLPTYTTGAKLIFESNTHSIGLSEHYSFKAAPTDRVEILLDFLFQLKRQLEGSSLPLPQMRIKLFAQKFHRQIFHDAGCSLSLFPLPLAFPKDLRDGFVANLLKATKDKDYQYDSKWSRFVLMVEIGQTFSSSCFGMSRSRLTLSARLLDWKNLTYHSVSEVIDSSCDGVMVVREKLLKQFLKKINQMMPTCLEHLAH